MPKAAKKKQDRQTGLIYKRLKARFPSLPEDVSRVVYRYNPAAIRVRVIDPAFVGKSYGEREALLGSPILSLPEEVERDITLLLLLTPDEAARGTDLMNLEFDDPTGERL